MKRQEQYNRKPMPMGIDDLLLSGLSNWQLGITLRLLMFYWLRRCQGISQELVAAQPGGGTALYRVARVEAKEWKQWEAARDLVFGEIFKQGEDKLWHCLCLLRAYTKAEETHAKHVNAARKRWAEAKEAPQLPPAQPKAAGLTPEEVDRLTLNPPDSPPDPRLRGALKVLQEQEDGNYMVFLNY